MQRTVQLPPRLERLPAGGHPGQGALAQRSVDGHHVRHAVSNAFLSPPVEKHSGSTGWNASCSKGHVGGYDQWGVLHGQVQVEGADAQEVYLRGLRQRRWGPNEAGRLHRRLTISGVVKNGTMFSVGADCHPGQLSQ